MTITSAQSNIANLLSQVTIQGGTADVGRLSKQQASQLLNAMAKDSLTAGGSVKSGYFRVLTDKHGAITEIGRSSVSSKGRDAATSLIKALVARALGEDSPELTSLNSYLQRSGDKVGSKSLVKLIAAKSIENKNDGLASMNSFTLKEQFTAEQRTAFSNYMQRIGENVRDDTTGRLRLPTGEIGSAQHVRTEAPKNVGSNAAGELSFFEGKPGSGEHLLSQPGSISPRIRGQLSSLLQNEAFYESVDRPMRPGEITKLNANEAKQQAEEAMADSVLNWLNAGPQTFEEDLAALKLTSDWTKQRWEAENVLREASGKDRLGLEDLEDLRSKILAPALKVEASGLDEASRQKWVGKIENSPALAALRRIADRVNDELLKPSLPQQRQSQLEDLLALATFSATQLVRVRDALGLKRLSEDELMILNPTEQNTSPETFRNIEALFDSTRIR